MRAEQTNAGPISDHDKITCLERELGMRRRVYPNRIRQGLMQPAQAHRELAVMAAIRDDYRAKVQPSLLLER